MKLRAVDLGEGWATTFLGVCDGGAGPRILPKWRGEAPVVMSLDGQVVLEPDGINGRGISVLQAVAEAARMNDEWERRKR
jgi:hypothetical protein